MTLIAQASFNSGEWSPKLFARVDLQKYRSGAALLENWFVDYRGGASTRPGTKYIIQCYKSTTAVRLIPFQASFSVGYVLEFGDQYIRFIFNGAPVLTQSTTIASAAGTNPVTFTDTAHGYNPGDWLFIGGNYYIVQTAATNTFTLTDLFGNQVNTNPFTLPATAQKVYIISSPYTAGELAQLKFSQNVNTLILCHPNHQPYQLVLTAADNWALTPISFGASISPPVSITLTTTLGAGPVTYSYVITAIDANDQESAPSNPANTSALQNMATTPGSISIAWGVAAGATRYNVYKSVISYFGAAPAGASYGFIGTTTGTSIVDTNIGADFSQTPPVPQNPFFGSSVSSLILTASGSYGSVPGVIIAPPPSGVTATASALLGASSGTVAAGGTGYAVNDTVSFYGSATFRVTSINLGGNVTGVQLISSGSVAVGSVPTNNAPQLSTSGSGTGLRLNLVWGVNIIQLNSGGTGYITAPAVSFTGGGGASATAFLGASGNGNPTVPGFFQQRLVLAGEVNNPQGFNMSKPGLFYNFDVSTISQPDDAISGTIVSGQLNTIRWMVPQPAGLLMFTDRSSWLINGGTGAGSAVSPSAIVANAQSFNGIADVPPIVANFDVLYVQAKGSSVRDSAYNIYANVYTGTDISLIASHLFFGFTIKEWAWAEEPFKMVWAVRSDGIMLTLTFLKEQEFIGWSHSLTNGSFLSVAAIVESTPTAGLADAIYTVVQRTINGQSVQYIERVVERTFPSGAASAWCVDCGIQYSGAPASNFSGAQFLGGQTVTGLADGQIITPFVMPASGQFTLPTPASVVTIGIGYTCDLQTLPLDLGDPTIQGKVKKINHVDVRVAETLNLKIGASLSSLTQMKDLVRGNVSSTLVGQPNQIITDLVDGDAMTYLDPTYTVPGQYCIRQSDPLPATVLGVFVDATIGDGGPRP